MKILLFSAILSHIFLLNLVAAQNDSTTDEVLSDEWSYCFDFTWFGPKYYNGSLYNGTCSDYLDDTRADNNIPCRPPIVITYDATPPDIDYLWEHHRASVLCRRAADEVCASYTYYSFNGQVSNATYMCTKVMDTASMSAVNSGCFKQNVDGYQTKLCICKSEKGVYKPCNSAQSFSKNWGLLLLVIVFLLND